MVCGEDVEVLLGSDNLCVGLKAGLEGGFHAMLEKFQSDLEVEGILLLDAANAFNNLNRDQDLAEIRKKAMAKRY